MKSILNKLAVSFVLAGATGSAYAVTPLIPLPTLGEGAGIHGLLDASVSYNDNIYLSDSDEDGDTIFTISPGVEFTNGDEARSRVSLRFVENFTFYMDETDNNRALENIDFTFNHGAEGDKLKLAVAAGFHHNQSASSRESRTSGSMTRSYNYYANGIVSYKLGEKTSVRSGFKWNGTTYDNHRYDYNDRQQYAIPLYLYYAVTAKLNAGLTAEWRYVDLAASGRNRAPGVAGKDGRGNPGTQQVWFFGLSAEGNAWEKLSLRGRVGLTTSDYSDRTIDDLDSKNTFGMGITADYKATEKLSTSLSLSRDFELGGAAEGILSTAVTLGAKYRITDLWSANASLGYRLDDYQSSDREDDIYTFSVGASYAINDYASAYASYSLSVDDSNTSGDDYTNNIFTVGLSFRY